MITLPKDVGVACSNCSNRFERFRTFGGNTYDLVKASYSTLRAKILPGFITRK